MVDPDIRRTLIEDQNHENNNRDWKCSHLNSDRVAFVCHDLGDYDVPIDWVQSGTNERSWWDILPDNHVTGFQDTEPHTSQGDAFGTKLTDPL